MVLQWTGTKIVQNGGERGFKVVIGIKGVEYIKGVDDVI